MLLKILLVIAALVALVLVIAAFRPVDFSCSRSIVISAPPSAIFPEVNDYRKWVVWSPFELDPAIQRTFSGPATGVGASYSWSGNREVGEGRATITESVPGEKVQMKLEFVRPFAGTNIAEFTFKPQGSQTVVSWSFTGHNNFMCRVVGVFVNMEKMVGGQFEKGLGSLKTLAEKSATK